MNDRTNDGSGKPAQEAPRTPDEQRREAEAESLIRWATARAGVIVVAPVMGSMALMANEAYMVVRMAKLHGIQLGGSAIGGFLAGLGGTLAGQTLATTFPFPPLQIPIGMSVTYAVGKVAKAWLNDGMPKDLSSYRQILEVSKAEVRKDPGAFKDHPDKDQPMHVEPPNGPSPTASFATSRPSPCRRAASDSTNAPPHTSRILKSRHGARDSLAPCWSASDRPATRLERPLSESARSEETEQPQARSGSNLE